MLYSRHSLNRWVHELLGRGYEYSDSDSDAPVTRFFSKRKLRTLFDGFGTCSFRKRYLFTSAYGPVSYLLPRRVKDWLGRLLGWHWLITCEKLSE